MPAWRSGNPDTQVGTVHLIDPHVLHSDNMDNYFKRKHDPSLGGPRLHTPRHDDEYFAGEPEDSELADTLDGLVEQLSEVEQEVIRMHVYERLTFREIAEHFEWECGDPPYPDKKKAYRILHRGLAKLETMLYDTKVELGLDDE